MSGAYNVDEYIRASTIDEVLGVLNQYGNKAIIIGGGVTIHELGFRGLLGDVRKLIDISGLGLTYVREDSFGLLIGASTTFTELRNSEPVHKNPGYAALVDALHAIRPVQVRNQATVGGAVCSGLPLLDLPPTFMALDAMARLVGSNGERIVDLKDFFLGYLQTALRSGEFLTEIQVPRPTAKTGSAFQKLETNAVDWALVSVATKITLQNGTAANVRIFLGGGIGEVPVRAIDAEALLEKTAPTADIIGRVAEEVGNRVKFVSDERASAGYRRDIAKVFVKENLSLSVARANQN